MRTGKDNLETDITISFPIWASTRFNVKRAFLPPPPSLAVAAAAAAAAGLFKREEEDALRKRPFPLS